MFTRLFKHVITATALLGFGGWAVGIGLPATGILTPFWGWVLTIVGGLACISAIPLAFRGVRLFREENQEIKSRRPFIAKIKGILGSLETQIDDVRYAVEKVPLSNYETKYLSKFDGYQEFKKKYIAENNATERDAQYVAISVHYGINDNPLFSDSLKKSLAQSSLNYLADLEQKLPDSPLHTLIELLVDTKKMQSISIIDHKLNPARWNAYTSDIERRSDVEQKFEDAIRKARRGINKRLTQLENGAKYE